MKVLFSEGSSLSARESLTALGLLGHEIVICDPNPLSLTETGHPLLADARAMLALAEDAEQRLHEDQAALRGHLRLFATIDFGQSLVTRLIANFLQTNPGVTAELGYTNRPVHVIQEG